jgi:hemerythrin-like metal-binding protein
VILDLSASPIYCTGLDAIDRQHQVLITQIGVVRSLLPGGDPGAQHAAMADLLECSYGHFAYEEDELLLSGDPHLARHRETHSRMLITLDRMAARSRGGRPAPQEDGDFFTMWLSAHILGVDKRYVPLMRAHGRGVVEDDIVLSRFPRIQ